MSPDELRHEIRECALKYARTHELVIDETPASAVIFQKVRDNFLPASFQAIEDNCRWLPRTTKPHQNLSGVLEMQSSNSSDALLMSVFCPPKFGSWKGVSDLLGFVPNDPEFGFLARVANANPAGDTTEIDMVVGDYFVEAKLTEKDFTSREIAHVGTYQEFANCFHTEALRNRDGRYENYQVIRNLLASIQHGKRHMLICDERRPDLARNYMETVACLKDINHRLSCRVVFWQEIAKASGNDLRRYLMDRYGI